MDPESRSVTVGTFFPIGQFAFHQTVHALTFTDGPFLHVLDPADDTLLIFFETFEKAREFLATSHRPALILRADGYFRTSGLHGLEAGATRIVKLRRQWLRYEKQETKGKKSCWHARSFIFRAR